MCTLYWFNDIPSGYLISKKLALTIPDDNDDNNDDNNDDDNNNNNNNKPVLLSLAMVFPIDVSFLHASGVGNIILAELNNSPRFSLSWAEGKTTFTISLSVIPGIVKNEDKFGAHVGFCPRPPEDSPKKNWL